jgi:hypothetical protein
LQHVLNPGELQAIIMNTSFGNLKGASISPDWTLDNIPLDKIDLAKVRDREDLFYMVTAASFVEITSDLYSANLASFFEDDPEITEWLTTQWEAEEVRHGVSLRSYVNAVWPEFDWEAAYKAFFDDYSRLCSFEQYESRRELEMVARCVVETGTATFYQTLASEASEPVLVGIAMRIRAEEINHYKHFYHYFLKLSAIQAPSRFQVIATLRRRLFEARKDDAECALWHVFSKRNPSAIQDKVQFEALCKQLGNQIQLQYPIKMAARMLLKPLDLPTGVSRMIEGSVARYAGWVLRH